MQHALRACPVEASEAFFTISTASPLPYVLAYSVLPAARLAHLSDVAEAELDRGLAQAGEGVKQLAKELQHNTEPYMQASVMIALDHEGFYWAAICSSCLL